MAIKIIFENYGGPEQLITTQFEPRAPGCREVQIKNKAIGVNFIDTYYRKGLYPVREFPSVPGTEGAGIVTSVGENVSFLKEGDRVAYISPDSAYSEVVNIDASRVVLLPERVSFSQAAASFVKGMTVFFLFKQIGNIKPDDEFLFHAASGGVGVIACQWARVLRAKMIGTVSSERKAEIARKYGAWKVINYTNESVSERVNELTGGRKVRVVFDSIGQDMWLSSLDSLSKKGLLVSYGNASGPVTKIDLSILNKKGSLFVTRPSLFHYIESREELVEASTAFFSLLNSGAIQIEVPPSQQFALTDAAAAHLAIESRLVIGSCILVP